MKNIEKDELFENLRVFLGSKGIQLTEGAYSQTIQKSCRILADVINMGQQGIERAKTGIDTKLDQVRQAIHQKTAPKGDADAKTAEEEPSSKSSDANGKEVPGSAEPVPKVKSKGKIRPKKTAGGKTKSARKPKPPTT